MLNTRSKRALTGSLTGATAYLFSQNGSHPKLEYSPQQSLEDAQPLREQSNPAVELRNNTPYKGSPQRPNRLGTPTSTRAAMIDEDELDDSSLPCTPDMPAAVVEGDGHCASFDSDTRRHMSAFYRDLVAPNRGPSCFALWDQQDKVQATLRRVVDGVLEKHQYAYNGMIRKLELDSRGDDMSVITSVAQSLFEDRTTNWGRIASLIAFGAAVSQYQATQGRTHCATLVAAEISSYLLAEQRDWLIKNDGWEGMVEFFRLSDPEGSVRTGLITLAGLAGIGATLALLIR